VNDPQQLLLLPLWYVVFLLSLTCHEAAHALAALWGGDRTAYLGGQVTLNPLPHVSREPMGTILVPLITFFMFEGNWMMGWASAPYDPLWEDRHPARASWMALAGPVANLLLAVLAFGILKIGLDTGLWVYPLEGASFDRLVAPVGEGAGALEALSRLSSILLFLNLVLFLFNLIPVPPLDGASVLAGWLPPARRMRQWLRGSPLGGLAGLLVAWVAFPKLFSPVWHWVFNALFG
jgi:Zn-dependent protease